MPALRRSAQLGTLLATLLLSAGCGGDEPKTQPAPAEALEPAAPADLCATVPKEARDGLVASSSSSAAGNPTAACSLRSPDGASNSVQATVIWLQSHDDLAAEEALDSQCSAIDRSEFQIDETFSAEGATKACGASGRRGGVDSATLGGLNGLEIVTVRVSVEGGRGTALERGREMLEGVLRELTGTPAS